MSKTSILIYAFRRDLRLTDNPLLHRLATSRDHGFTHLLPVYIVPPHQMEVSGFIKNDEPSPYPEARSAVGGYHRCGPYRARFIGEAVWDAKENLQALGSDLVIRVGKYGEVIRQLIQGLREKQQHVTAVWITGDVGVEEHRDEKDIADTCKTQDVEFKAWSDEKVFIDE
jgi:deoxyribodipyrimidine photo-lyase